MNTALMVIDMQNGFVDPTGSVPSTMGALPGIEQVIANCADVIVAARSAGLRVVYTRHQFRPGLLDAPSAVMQRFPVGTDPLVAGTWDAAICDALEPVPGDVIVDKNRYDAFFYTDMELVLRAIGVGRVLVMGVVTNVCVESTVRAAHMRDYEVTVASDCTAAQPGYHEPALAAMAGMFATVAPWQSAFTDVLGMAAVA